jgi:glycosyl-4,4'-diaponeurosporenoate acyltransferase
VSATVLERRNLWLAAIDVGVWAGWSALAGYLAHRVSVDRLGRDGWLFRLRRRPERVARRYERLLRIKRWKSLLPKAGDLFKGGFSKRRMLRRDRAYLRPFVVETHRAELTPLADHVGGAVLLLVEPVVAGGRHGRLCRRRQRSLPAHAAIQPGPSAPDTRRSAYPSSRVAP